MPDRRSMLKMALGLACAPMTWSAGCRTSPAPAAGVREAALTSLGVAGRLDAAPAIADAGGEHLEASVGRLLVPDQPEARFADIAARVRDAPLPVIACNGFVPARLRSVGPDADHEAVLAWARVACARAQRVGVGTIVFGSSGSRAIPEGYPRGRAADQFATLLGRMGPIARRHEVTICLEPLRPQEVNFINTVAEGAALVRRVDDPNVQLTADLYHMLQADETPAGIVSAAETIRHTHIAESDGRTTPGVHGEDFRPYLSALQSVGYRGPMSIEGRWEPGDLARGFALIRQQWSDAAHGAGRD